MNGHWPSIHVPGAQLYTFTHFSHHPTSGMILSTCKQENCLPRGVRSFSRSYRTCGAGGGRADQFALVPFPSLLLPPREARKHCSEAISTVYHSEGNTGQVPGRQNPKHPCSASRTCFYSAGVACFRAALRSGLQSCGTAAWRFGAVSRNGCILILENIFPS